MIMKRFNVVNARCSIPWVVIAPHEGQAFFNHGQSLDMLNRRGGLAWSEIIAVLEDRRYTKMDEREARKMVEEIVKNTVCTVQMVKYDDGHYLPMECCTMTNPLTSGGMSEIDDIDLPCGQDCEKDCNNCIIQKIMDEYAEITMQAK